MGEVGVNGSCDNLAVHLLEFWEFVGELANLSWAHKCEVKRVEEKNHILSFELFKTDLLELVLPP